MLLRDWLQINCQVVRKIVIYVGFFCIVIIIIIITLL